MTLNQARHDSEIFPTSQTSSQISSTCSRKRERSQSPISHSSVKSPCTSGEIKGQPDLPLCECDRVCHLFLLHNVSKGLAKYSFGELLSATDEKSSVMKLGQGGFGEVFMGRLRHTLVAIKFFRVVRTAHVLEQS